MENLAATGVRIPDRRARSQSLYRLRLKRWPRVSHSDRNHATHFLKHVLFVKKKRTLKSENWKYNIKCWKYPPRSEPLSTHIFPHVWSSVIDSMTPEMHTWIFCSNFFVNSYFCVLPPPPSKTNATNPVVSDRVIPGATIPRNYSFTNKMAQDQHCWICCVQ